ncbi:MAG: hypothetical protein FWF15_09490 [Oscillospiraceae bacterium]|nr:hypothetical protein [Oscillospiraceae bacterium]
MKKKALFLLTIMLLNPLFSCTSKTGIEQKQTSKDESINNAEPTDNMETTKPGWEAYIPANMTWGNDDGPAIGFLEYMADAKNSEFQYTSAFGTRVLKFAGYRYGLTFANKFWLASSQEEAYNQLKEFDVVFLDNPYEIGLDPITHANQAKYANAALKKYLNNGGNVILLLQPTRYQTDDWLFANMVYDGLGIELMKEGIFDEGTQFSTKISPLWDLQIFFTTDNIAVDNRLTNGVNSLTFPKFFDSSTPGCIAASYSDEWTILARGGPTSKSYGLSTAGTGLDLDLSMNGTYGTGEAPVAASREYGNGKMLAVSIQARNSVFNYGKSAWYNICEETGNPSSSAGSGNTRLIMNAIEWMTENYKDYPDVGTFNIPYASSEPEIIYPDKWIAGGDIGQNRQPRKPGIDWLAPAPGISGIVGVKTTYSSGTSTVAEYAEAAQAAGLAFIVFTDDLKYMTEEDLENLKADCAANTTGKFYCCPGIEFTDESGNDWAVFSDRIKFPTETFPRAYLSAYEAYPDHVFNKDPDIIQWNASEGIMYNVGHYWWYNNFPSNILLNQSTLEERGMNPEWLWYYYHVAPYVYDVKKGKAEQVEDNFSSYLTANRNMFRVEAISYTRVYSATDVVTAAETCVTTARSLGTTNSNGLRAWLNNPYSKIGGDFEAYAYIAQGVNAPKIQLWKDGWWRQADLPLSIRGVQQLPMRFTVTSEIGISEVRIHDADIGIIRRFVPQTVEETKKFTKEFNMTHDRDHWLTLEVIDIDGNTAVSYPINMFCYKTSIFRCADNYNLLNGIGLVWHFWQYMSMAQDYQGTPDDELTGFDTSNRLAALSQYSIVAPTYIHTAEGLYPSDGYCIAEMQVRLAGKDVKVCESVTGPVVEGFDSSHLNGKTDISRDSPPHIPVPKTIEENDLYERREYAYYMQNRANMFTKWDYQRYYEGSKDYEGGVVWHEGTITFKKDVTLTSDVPIELIRMVATGVLEGRNKSILVTDNQLGLMKYDEFKNPTLNGKLAPGGFIVGFPMDHNNAVITGNDGDLLTYSVVNGEEGYSVITIGLGIDMMKVSAGQTLTYKFAVLTTGEPYGADENYYRDLFSDIQRYFGLGDSGINAQALVGTKNGQQMFLELTADKNEVVIDFAPTKMMIDLPIKVKGIIDNGSAAVYSAAHPFYRYIGVGNFGDVRDTAILQEKIDGGGKVWIGNIFLSDNPDIKFTVADCGIWNDPTPFVEMFNPTDADITTTITCPDNVPALEIELAGKSIIVTIPAGASIKVNFADM